MVLLPRQRQRLLLLALELADRLDEASLSDSRVLLPVWGDHHHHQVDLAATLLRPVASLAHHHQDLLAAEDRQADHVSF